MELLNSLKKLYGPLTIDADTNGPAVDVTGASIIAFEVQVEVTSAVSGADVVLQKSLGGDIPESEWIWVDEGVAQTITATGNFYLEQVNPSGNYYRLSYDLAGGEMVVTVRGLGKTLV